MLNSNRRSTAQILYGSVLRLREAMQLRVKDLDFTQHQIVVRDAKGHESQVTMLPSRLVAPLQEHLRGVQSPQAAKLRFRPI